MHNSILLTKIAEIGKRHDEISKLRGDEWNIFHLLGVSTNEVKLHSAILTDLLNHHGSHGLGGAFLVAFIDVVLKVLPTEKQKLLLGFDTQSSSAKTEVHVGKIDEDIAFGGRIDIVITDRYRNQIIIENKILAGDQDLQLLRYYNFDSTAPIFYLTLDGSGPSRESAGHLMNGEHYHCLSYKNEIIEWITTCKRIAVDFPLLRETLQQYINLLRTLTGQNNSNLMESEIVEVIVSSDEMLRSAHAVTQSLDAAKRHRIKAITDRIKEEIESKNIPVKISEWHFDFPRLEFYPLTWTSHLIGFTDERGLLWGIKRIDEKVKPVKFEEIRSALSGNWKTSSWWLAYTMESKGLLNLRSIDPYLKASEAELVDWVVTNVKALIEDTELGNIAL